jgi:hypothetical protein
VDICQVRRCEPTFDVEDLFCGGVYRDRLVLRGEGPSWDALLVLSAWLVVGRTAFASCRADTGDDQTFCRGERGHRGGSPGDEVWV